MSKYVIKNCPCYFKEGECCWDGTEDFVCKNITNCLLKKIVEKCKENLNSLETYVDVRSFECATLQNILQLLDIEECE